MTRPAPVVAEGRASEQNGATDCTHKGSSERGAIMFTRKRAVRRYVDGYNEALDLFGGSRAL